MSFLGWLTPPSFQSQIDREINSKFYNSKKNWCLHNDWNEEVNRPAHFFLRLFELENRQQVDI